MSKGGKVIGLPIVNARAAGIDIGSRIQVVAAYSTRWRTRFQADGGQHSILMTDT